MEVQKGTKEKYTNRDAETHASKGWKKKKKKQHNAANEKKRTVVFKNWEGMENKPKYVSKKEKKRVEQMNQEKEERVGRGSPHFAEETKVPALQTQRIHEKFLNHVEEICRQKIMKRTGGERRRELRRRGNTP